MGDDILKPPYPIPLSDGVSDVEIDGTPADNELLAYDSATGKWINQTAAEAGVTGGGDSDAIHDNVAAEISAIAEKATPVNADVLVIEDSAASYAKKKVQITNLPAGTPGADSIDDTMIDWGAGANQVDADDVPESATKKWAGETGATTDQTGAEIKTAYEAEADTNAYNDAAVTKLAGIATAATKYPDTGEQAFLDADHTKLNGIAANADVTGSNAPQAHAASHQNGGADEPSVTGLSGLLADDQHVLDTEVVAAVKAGNYVPRTYVWFVKGTVATGTEQGATFRIKRTTTVEDVEMHVKTAPTGAALIVDINDGGTTIFSTEPEIDISGTTEDDNHAFSDTSLAATTELTMDVVQVGSTIAGADLTVLLHVKELVI